MLRKDPVDEHKHMAKIGSETPRQSVAHVSGEEHNCSTLPPAAAAVMVVRKSAEQSSRQSWASTVRTKARRATTALAIAVRAIMLNEAMVVRENAKVVAESAEPPVERRRGGAPA